MPSDMLGIFMIYVIAGLLLILVLANDNARALLVGLTTLAFVGTLFVGGGLLVLWLILVLINDNKQKTALSNTQVTEQAYKTESPTQVPKKANLVHEPMSEQLDMTALRMNAEKGSVTAQYDLGMMYENGRGVSRDIAEAAKLYRKAA